ncbi:YgdI/YgdR family lipoprotein [Candidatus Woesearchaeota archaeon]|nr:YgdI/YgdR family lipoprotein [Candidatus Woesearchaeota archaeon]
MKKTIAVLLLLLIGTMVLVGCSSQTLEPAEKGEVQEKAVKKVAQPEEEEEFDFSQPPAFPEE